MEERESRLEALADEETDPSQLERVAQNTEDLESFFRDARSIITSTGAEDEFYRTVNVEVRRINKGSEGEDYRVTYQIPKKVFGKKLKVVLYSEIVSQSHDEKDPKALLEQVVTNLVSGFSTGLTRRAIIDVKDAVALAGQGLYVANLEIRYEQLTEAEFQAGLPQKIPAEPTAQPQEISSKWTRETFAKYVAGLVTPKTPVTEVQLEIPKPPRYSSQAEFDSAVAKAAANPPKEY